MEKITLLHTNDLHSHFENWPKIRRFLLETQATRRAEGHTVLTFDDGDAMDRFAPLTEATDGQFNVQLLNEVHYDAVTIGNNEGIGNSHSQLEHLYDHANFPVVLANLFEADGQRPHFAHSVIFKQTPAGTRIAIIGFTAPFFLTYAPNGWTVKAVGAVLPELLAEIAGQYDVLIMLSHLGIGADRYLATHFPQINIIIGGHTHHLLRDGQQVDATMLTAAEKYGHYIGQVELALDDRHHVKTVSAHTIETATLADRASDAREIAGYAHKGQAVLAQAKVAALPKRLAIAPIGESPLLQAGLTAVATAGNTEAAILNTGLFLTDLGPGVISRADLLTCLPHPMHLLKVTLRGQELWRLVMEIEKNRYFLRPFPMQGMSFRGDRFGDVGFLGITVDDKKRVLWQGAPLQIDRDYTFTTVDNFMFIPFFPTIEIMGTNEFLFPRLLRTVVGDYLAQKYPLAAML